MRLHLGVIEMPYADVTDSHATTGDVAEILEAKYHIMQLFFDRHEQEIANALAESMSGAIENLLLGAPASNNPFGSAENTIRSLFVTFLDNEELAGIKGVPTKAALDGVNSRLKNPKGGHVKPRKKIGKRRPSFIDTGLYRTAFMAWMEDY